MTARLLYTAIVSLDGYVADENGDFDFLAPDDEVHAFINDLERPIGTYLLGRRMYDVLSVWETMDDDAPVMKDFAESWRSIVNPIVIGAGNAALPDDVRIELELLDEHRFASDVVYLRYRVRPSA